uniref:hypothetical protein n=1 Tax=Thaumasiovibrio occultus TaxID=1891184 RepID=UPI000B35B1A5|nr:hypothetical protein [Thaumasiovibrio occultus]
MSDWLGAMSLLLLLNGETLPCRESTSVVINCEQSVTPKNRDFVVHEYHLKEEESFWQSWYNDSPTFSDTADNGTHYGLSFIAPEEDINDRLRNDESIEKWLREHRLNMSVGLGDSEPDAPKMRLDYSWHEDDDGEILLQFQVPLK